MILLNEWCIFFLPNFILNDFAGYIKYVSLAILTIQNAALGLSMRYARTREVEMFSSTAGKSFKRWFIFIYLFSYFMLLSYLTGV